MDDKETLNRRARLRELIDACFDRQDVNLINFIAAKTGKRINQGELSAIQKDNNGKSFGDKKARTLTLQIGLNRRWFDMRLGANLDRASWMLDEPIEGDRPQPAKQPSEALELHNQYHRAGFARQAIVDIVLGGPEKAPEWMSPTTLKHIELVIEAAQEQSPDTTKKSDPPSRRKA